MPGKPGQPNDPRSRRPPPPVPRAVPPPPAAYPLPPKPAKQPVPKPAPPKPAESAKPAFRPPIKFPAWIWDPILVLIVLALYAPAMTGDFTWDDWRAVRDNPLLRDFGGLVAIWTQPTRMDAYYPLTTTTFWVEHRLFGASTTVYHLVNALLHAACAIALRRLLVRLHVPGAALAAVLVAVHPLFVESVAWIAERKNVLSGVFYLLSALAFVRFLEIESTQPPATGWRRWQWYVLACGFGALAMLSKVSTVVLPVTLLLLAWWVEGRIKPSRLVQVVPILAVAVACAAVGMWMENMRPRLLEPLDWSFAQRLRVAAQVPWFYLSKLLVPRNLLIIYPDWKLTGMTAAAWVAIAGILAVLAGLWIVRRSWGRGPLVGWLHYLLALMPVMGFVNIGYFRFTPVADHFAYLAGIGMIALLVGMAAMLLRRWLGERRALAWAVGPVVLVVLGMSWISVKRTARFGAPEMLWAETVQLNPNSWMARMNLAEHLKLGKQVKPAIRVLEDGLKRTGSNPEVHDQLAGLYAEVEDRESALDHASRGVRWRKEVGQQYSDYGTVLIQQGDFRRAASMLRRALAADNEPAVRTVIQANLAFLLATCPDPRVHNPQEALDLAVALNSPDAPPNPVYLNLLAIAQAQTGKLENAMRTIQQAEDAARRDNDQEMFQSILRTRERIEQMMMQPAPTPTSVPSGRP